MLVRTLLLVSASVAFAAAEPLTNQGLVQLAEAGYSEAFLLDLIQTRPTRFDTSVGGLVYLAKQGLSEKLLRTVAGLDAKKQEDKQNAQAQQPVRLRMSREGTLTTEQGSPVTVLIESPLKAKPVPVYRSNL
ncbi:MAG: hypothetical protein IT168_32850 [Bryobacterales bacterium]|nr:hypothetical protein [Bryobacterales bacterium]